VLDELERTIRKSEFRGGRGRSKKKKVTEKGARGIQGTLRGGGLGGMPKTGEGPLDNRDDDGHDKQNPAKKADGPGHPMGRRKERGQNPAKNSRTGPGG